MMSRHQLSLISSGLKIGLIAAMIFALVTETSIAQEVTTAPSAQPSSVSPKSEAPVQFTIPPGTQIPLLLAHPVQSRLIHHGDLIYAQTTSPVSIGAQVVIPAGSFAQGPVSKLTRQGERGQFLMQSLAISLPDGYVVDIPGPITINSENGTALRDPNGSVKGGAIAALVGGPAIGMAIGLSVKKTETLQAPAPPPGFPTLPQQPTLTHTSPSAKAVGIGTAVGTAAGVVTGLLLLSRTRNFFVDVSSPMTMVLPQPVVVNHVPTPQSVSGPQTPLPAQRPRPVFTDDHHTCWPNTDPTRGPITNCQ